MYKHNFYVKQISNSTITELNWCMYGLNVLVIYSHFITVWHGWFRIHRVSRILQHDGWEDEHHQWWRSHSISFSGTWQKRNGNHHNGRIQEPHDQHRRQTHRQWGAQTKKGETDICTKYTHTIVLCITLLFFVLQFEMLIGEADKDGDGNLDYEEFVHLMTSSWYSMRKIEVAIDSMTRRTVAFDRIYC